VNIVTSKLEKNVSEEIQDMTQERKNEKML